MAMWFAAFIHFTYIWNFSPCYPSPVPYPHCPSPGPPTTDLSVWCSPPCVLVFSLFNTLLWVRTCGASLFLCQFAENDGFQVHPCPYKGHKLIVFYGFIVFHGVYVPHYPCPAYHRWAFELVPSLCYVNSAAINIHVHVSLEWFIILWIYTQ